MHFVNHYILFYFKLVISGRGVTHLPSPIYGKPCANKWEVEKDFL